MSGHRQVLAGFAGFFDLRGLALTALRGAAGCTMAGRPAALLHPPDRA
jgi:hypothetical protein